MASVATREPRRLGGVRLETPETGKGPKGGAGGARGSCAPSGDVGAGDGVVGPGSQRFPWLGGCLAVCAAWAVLVRAGDR
jgi:hypothetical protein